MNFAILGLIVVAYFIPSIVASNKGKRDKNAIIVLNVFLGWTLLGWIAALVWATMEDKHG